ncbi:MAG: flavodoxin domain-containing protein [Candidatus Bathyarchaeota archaeon]|nr:flavodoxin domain-containing protein [Candidatus Bathyarchaeota archaeon]
MNTCVVFFSRTGNTKRFAQAIAQAANAKLLDLAQIQPDALSSYDMIILGTPVEGASPAKETAAFIANIPPAQNRKAILFATYRVFGNERSMKAIEKVLAEKGYETVLKVSKKGMKPEQPADFNKEVAQIKAELEKQK